MTATEDLNALTEDTLLDEKPFVSEWLVKNPPTWEAKNTYYWKSIFKRASAEAVLPPVPRWPEDRVIRAQWLHKERELYILPQDLLEMPAPPTVHEWVRRLRYIYRSVSNGVIRPRAELKDPTLRYGLFAGAYIKRAMARQQKNLDCVDNQRFAACDDKWARRQYWKAQRRGCCGSIDETITFGFRQFLIGCNYGH